MYWEQRKAFSGEGLGLAACATDGGRRYELLYECLDSQEPSEPVSTLDILTVEPSEPRGGIGSAFVEHGLGLARRSQCASFLDTSRPELVGYYARFGFAVDSEADLLCREACGIPGTVELRASGGAGVNASSMDPRKDAAALPEAARLVSEESWERGQAARKDVSRSAHGEWMPAADRPDPIMVLQGQATTRVQELVPIRYGRMLVSPFTFYRGGAAVMAADLARTPDSGIVVQACGDAHISNFGGFAAQDRRLIFGPNDFDETLPGPWEWDVKRMAASVEIAGREIDIPAERRSRLVAHCVREYREAMRGFAHESHLDVWYERINASELVGRFGGRLGDRGRIQFTKPFAKARRKTSLRAVAKLTEKIDGKPRFRHVPPLLIPFRELLDARVAHQEAEYVRELINEYRQGLDPDRRYLFDTYRFVDMARKVVGMGSVGTRAWIVLTRRP